MTYWREVEVLNAPFEFNVDANNRSMWSFNMVPVTRPTAEIGDEVAAVIQDASLGTFGTDLFVGQKAQIPGGNGPYVQVLPNEGAPGERTHNSISQPAYSTQPVQIVVRALSVTVARTRIWAIHDLFYAKRMATVTGV